MLRCWRPLPPAEVGQPQWNRHRRARSKPARHQAPPPSMPAPAEEGGSPAPCRRRVPPQRRQADGWEVAHDATILPGSAAGETSPRRRAAAHGRPDCSRLRAAAASTVLTDTLFYRDCSTADWAPPPWQPPLALACTDVLPRRRASCNGEEGKKGSGEGGAAMQKTAPAPGLSGPPCLHDPR